MEGAGDSQEGELEALAAAFNSPDQHNEAGAVRGTSEAPSVAAVHLYGLRDIGGLRGAEPTTAAASGPVPSPPAPQPPVLQHPAAQAFSALCLLLGAAPHAELLRVLNELPAEVFAAVTPYQRPGRGGAVLKLPADALPAHVEAVLRMVAGSADIEGAAPGVPCDRYLRTVHLDMSGHPLTTAQVKMLLLEAPFTLKQCFMLEGLVLAGCHLQPDVMQVLQSWRMMRALTGVRRLVLAGNALLGCSLEQAQQGNARNAPPQEASPRFIEPAQLWWVQTRLFQAAPLALLDMQHLGLSDASWAEVLRQLATYHLPANVGAPQPEAPTHGGCRTTLECLKLGPPADCQHFSKDTVDSLARVLEEAAGLQVVQVAGLAPEWAPPLQLAWQQVQERRGRSGYVAPGPAGTLRFALADGAPPVAAERLPTEHEPLQPPTPEPRAQLADAQRLEHDAALMLWDQHTGVQQHRQDASHQHRHGEVPAWPAKLSQQHLTAFMEGRPRFTLQGRQQRQQPRTGLPFHNVRPSGYLGPRAMFGSGAALPASAAAIEDCSPPAELPSNAQCRAAAAVAAEADQHAGEQAGQPQQRRRQQRGEVQHGRDVMYQGGRREDDLRDFGDDVEMDDTYDLAEEGSEDDGDDGMFVPDDETISSDDAAEDYEDKLHRMIKHLKKKDPKAGKRAKNLKEIWDGVAFAYDRRRWENPSKDRADMIEELNALMQLKELLHEHGMHFSFRMPKEQRNRVLTWRSYKKEGEAVAAPTGQQQLQQQQGVRPRKKLRKLRELELQAMLGSDSEGDAAANAAATQRRSRRKQLVVEEDSDSGLDIGSMSLGAIQHHEQAMQPAQEQEQLLESMLLDDQHVDVKQLDSAAGMPNQQHSQGEGSPIGGQSISTLAQPAHPTLLTVQANAVVEAAMVAAVEHLSAAVGRVERLPEQQRTAPAGQDPALHASIFDTDAEIIISDTEDEDGG